MEAKIQFLRENQSNDFFKSLLEWYERKGFLSDKQIACIDRAMESEGVRQLAELGVGREFSMTNGTQIEIKTWLAKKLQEQLKTEFFFRNLEITEIMNETAKAFQVKIKFVSKIACNCHVCGRELDNEISKAVGIGPICAENIGLRRPNLESAKETLDQLEALCNTVGVLGPVWIPKSQIKLVLDNVIQS